MPSFNLILALTVSPFSRHYSAADWTMTQLLAVVFWLFLVRVTAASGEDLDRWLGEAVLDALGVIHMTVEQAADLMGQIDVSQLRKALRGEPSRCLSLNRLVRIGLIFWCAFGPCLFAVVVRHHLAQIAEDLKLRKSA